MHAKKKQKGVSSGSVLFAKISRLLVMVDYLKNIYEFNYRHSELIVRYNVCLETLLQQGISQPEFYDD